MTSITSIISRLRIRVEAAEFTPTRLGILTNPAFLVRKGIYGAVDTAASEFTGALLDVGCGAKPYESLFANATSYLGLDVEKSGHDHSNSSVDVYYDGKRFPFDDNTFDGIVAFEVIEHVEDFSELMSEIVRVGKPGARVLLTSPFVFPEHEVPFDFRRITQYGLRSACADSGITVRRIDKVGGFLTAITQLQILYAMRALKPRTTWHFALVFGLVVAPLNAIALLGEKILPSSDDLYLTTVLHGNVSEKTLDPSATRML